MKKSWAELAKASPDVSKETTSTKPSSVSAPTPAAWANGVKKENTPAVANGGKDGKLQFGSIEPASNGPIHPVPVHAKVLAAQNIALMPRTMSAPPSLKPGAEAKTDAPVTSSVKSEKPVVSKPTVSQPIPASQSDSEKKGQVQGAPVTPIPQQAPMGVPFHQQQSFTQPQRPIRPVNPNYAGKPNYNKGYQHPQQMQYPPAMMPGMFNAPPYGYQQPFYPQGYYPGGPIYRPPVTSSINAPTSIPPSGIPTPAAQATPVKPAPVTPRKSAAIKIINPNTNQEVKLPPSTPSKPAISTPAVTPATPAEKTTGSTPAPASEPSKVEAPKTVESTPTKSSRAVLKDPSTGNVIQVSNAKEANTKPVEDVKATPENTKEEKVESAPVKVADTVKPSPTKVTVVEPASAVKSTTATVVETAKKEVKSEPVAARKEENVQVLSSAKEEEVPVSRSSSTEPIIRRLITSAESEAYAYPETCTRPNVKERKYDASFFAAVAGLGIPILDVLAVHPDAPLVSNYRDRRPSAANNQRSGPAMSRQPSGGDRHRDRPRMASSKSGPPSMHRGGSGGPSMSRGGSRSGRKGGRAEPPPLPPVEKLVRSENAWVPGSQRTIDESEKVLRKTQAELNKLSLDLFDKISTKIINIGIDNMDILTGVIDRIYRKACEEKKYASMYASLCRKMMEDLPSVQSWMSADPKQNEFRRALLKKCQQTFESDSKWTEDDRGSAQDRAARRRELESLSSEEKIKFAEEELARSKMKDRVLGNVQFVGELFMVGMISEKIIHSCIVSLLKNVNDAEPEDVESMYKLMKTVGARIETPASLRHIDAYFARIKELSENLSLPSRIRFLLEDLIELRKNRWVLRGKDANSGPKTISEVHAEDAKEKAQKEKEKNRLTSRGGPKQNTKGNKRSNQGGNQDVRNQEWNTVKPRDYSSFGKLKISDNKNITFGPNSAQSASRTTPPSSGDVTPPESSEVNKFALLETPNQAASVSESDSDVGSGSEDELSKDDQLEKWKVILAQIKEKAEDLTFFDDIQDITNSEVVISIVEDLLNVYVSYEDSDDETKAANTDFIVGLFKDAFVGTPEFSFSVEDLEKGFMFAIGQIADENTNRPEIWVKFAQFFAVMMQEEVIEYSQFVTAARRLHNHRSPSPLAPQLLGSLLQYLPIHLKLALPLSGAGLEQFWPEDQSSFGVLRKWITKYSAPEIGWASDVLQELRDIYELDTFETGPLFRFLDRSIPEEAKVLGDEKFIPNLVKCILNRVLDESKSLSDIDAYKVHKKMLVTLQSFFTGHFGKELDAPTQLAVWTAICNPALPDALFENFARIFYESELLSASMFKEYQGILSASNDPHSKKALKLLTGWFKYLETEA